MSGYFDNVSANHAKVSGNIGNITGYFQKITGYILSITANSGKVMLNKYLGWGFKVSAN